MLLHLRRVIVLVPDERGRIKPSTAKKAACLFAISKQWPEIASRLADRARGDTVKQFGSVIVTEVPDETLLDLENEYGGGELDVCESCHRLSPCDAYSSYAESAAERLRLLSGEWVGSQWGWIAPSNVIQMAGVQFDEDRSKDFQDLIGDRPRKTGMFGLDAVREFFLGAIAEEGRRLREFAKGTKKRLRRKVRDTAGETAAYFAEEAFDAVADIGAQRLKDAFKAAERQRQEKRYAQAQAPREDPLEQAERMLDLKPPYSKEDLEVSYRIQARRHHPDVAGASGTEMMAKINVARDTIKAHHQW